MTPQRIVEVMFVELMVKVIDHFARMSRESAPVASVILAACAAKLREEYPEVEEEGADA